MNPKIAANINLITRLWIRASTPLIFSLILCLIFRSTKLDGENTRRPQSTYIRFP